MITDTGKPRLCLANTKEQESGFVGADLDELLLVPGQRERIGKGLQIVRGNYMRGRPHFADSLNIWYLDDFRTDELPVNDSLHGVVDAVCVDGWGDNFWRGPVVAYLKAGDDFDAKKMKDMTLTAYRDAADYLAYFREAIGSMIDQGSRNDHLGRIVMKDKTGKVKGVRINCVGDKAGDPALEFVQIEVPKTHPLFMLRGDDPLEIAANFDETWVADKYPGYKDADAVEAQNPPGRLLQLVISEDNLEADEWGSIPDWRIPYTTGSLLVVDRTRGDLGVGIVRAACRLMRERIEPLLDENADREEILEALTREALEEFM